MKYITPSNKTLNMLKEQGYLIIYMAIKIRWGIYILAEIYFIYAFLWLTS